MLFFLSVIITFAMTKRLRNCAAVEKSKIMKYVLRVYQWVIACPILLVLTILTALTTMLFSLLGMGKWAGYYPPKWWSRCWCWLMFVRVEVRNRHLINKRTSYVFVANHQGAYDIFSIYGYLGHNFRWMMKKSLEKVPFVGLACKSSGHIMVDRSSPSAIKATMDEAKEKLRDGMSLVVFPEGNRSLNGRMKEFKRGAFKLALDFNLPVVPITIDGSFKVLPRTTYNITSGKIILTIHEPIMPSAEGHDLDKVLAESYAKIQSALPQENR